MSGLTGFSVGSVNGFAEFENALHCSVIRNLSNHVASMSSYSSHHPTAAANSAHLTPAMLSIYPRRVEKPNTIALLNVLPSIILNREGNYLLCLSFGKLHELTFEEAEKVDYYPETKRLMFRNDMFVTRLNRQKFLAANPPSEEELTDSSLRKLFEQFCADPEKVSEREKHILYTYMHVDDKMLCHTNRAEAERRMTKMDFGCYLVRQMPIRDADGAIMRVLTARTMEDTSHVLIGYIFGLGYILFSGDMESMRVNGMPRPMTENTSKFDPRRLQINHLFGSFVEVLLYLSKTLKFKMADWIDPNKEEFRRL